MPIAILSAMAEENASLVHHMLVVKRSEIGRRVYHEGRLWGVDVVVVFSHWGKVAAASTASVLITRFDVSEIIFTGVAGAIDDALNVGDVIVASDLYQHDMDVRPLIARHEIPLLGVAAMASDKSRRAQLLKAANLFVDTQLAQDLPGQIITEFSLHAPKVMIAAIASGDQFIASSEQVADLRQRLPDVACVEMEGGAVAQVCTEFNIPFSLIRTISDAANEHAGIDFPKFIKEAAQRYSMGIVQNLLTAECTGQPRAQ